MKKKFYIKAALSIMSVALLSSCLKQSKYAVDFSTAKPLVELPGAANVSGTAGPFEAVALTSQATGTTPFNVPVNLAAVKPLGSSLTVKLSVDQAALDAYNTANSTTYTLLPASDYTSTLSATIPAGQNLANVVININTSVVDLTQSYVLPLTITDGGGQQISNYKTVLFAIQIKNKFDGEYTVTGTLTDVTTGAITGAYPEDVNLVTEGANTDAFSDASLGFAHAITSGGSVSSYAAFDPIFTFDPSANTVTAVNNFIPGGGSHNRSALIDPSAPASTSTGTPGTAGYSFTVNYIMYQGDISKNRTFFTETFTYKGARQ